MTGREHATVSVYDYDNNQVCILFDSTVDSDGQAYNITIDKKHNGYKELFFEISTIKNDENGDVVPNYRVDWLLNEYLIRVAVGSKVDWFIITEPQIEHVGGKSALEVTCSHVSVRLRMKKLYMVLDDTNGIGKCDNLANLILQGTGWSLGLCDTFYEANGTTEKIRTLTSSGKDGAYQLIGKLCELFNAVPIYNGDTRTVDIRSFAPFFYENGSENPTITEPNRLLELNYSKGMAGVKRKLNTDTLITRMYVEGEFGDDGYLGIEDVNPTGTNFVLDFSYFKSIGLFRPEHQTIVDNYQTALSNARDTSYVTFAQIEAKKNQLTGLWGNEFNYVIYDITNQVSTIAFDVSRIASARPDSAIVADTELYLLLSDGTVKYDAKVLGVTGNRITTTSAIPAGRTVVSMIAKVNAAAGAIGGKEVAIIAIDKSIDELDWATDAELIAEYMATRKNIVDGTSESEGLTPLVFRANTIAREIKDLQASYSTVISDIEAIENAFTNQMGDMLRDGYWQNKNYVVGQEEALYADAVDTIRIMSRPIATYEFDIIRMRGSEAAPEIDVDVHYPVHIIDESIAINTWGYVEDCKDVIDMPYMSTFTVSTRESSFAGQSFTDIISRIAEVAKEVAGKDAVFSRASIISADGQISTQSLQGIIDVNTTKLVSAMSNWKTDDNGNLLFTAQDGLSAMLLTGMGFMIASSKKPDGTWNWKTFGDGHGFTADVLNAGTVNAGLIKILGTNQFYWDADNIYIIDPDNHLRQIRIGRYDGINYGIGFTHNDGITWESAFGFDGIDLSYSTIPASQITGLSGTYLTHDEASNTYATTGTVGGINTTLTDLNDDIRMNIKFDNTGITIKKQDEAGGFSSKFTNSELGFYHNDTRMAYFSNNTLFVNNTHALIQQRIGNLIWLATGDGGVAAKWAT